MIGILPTGYGKSVIFQILPFIIPTQSRRNIIVVVCPLTSIILDQITALKLNNIVGAALHCEKYTGRNEIEKLFTSASRYDYSLKGTIGDNISSGDLDMLFAHPEDLLSEEGRMLMKSAVYKKNVVACIIDEAHCIEKW